MPENTILSENIKLLRKQMQLSQMEFAASCGISTEILSLLEREQTDPKLSTIQKVAAYVGCDAYELIRKQDANGALHKIHRY